MKKEPALPPKQKAQILMLYAAARRAYARHVEDAQAAETIAIYWTSWRIYKVLGYNAPMLRLALALGLSHQDVLAQFKAYHRAVRWIDGEVMGDAHQEFENLYAQMTGSADNLRRAS